PAGAPRAPGEPLPVLAPRRPALQERIQPVRGNRQGRRMQALPLPRSTAQIRGRLPAGRGQYLQAAGPLGAYAPEHDRDLPTVSHPRTGTRRPLWDGGTGG